MTELRSARTTWIVLGLLGLAGGAGWGAVEPARPPERRYTIDVWTTDDGLPQSSVIALVQGRDGYLWLGTLNGLVRFDGIRFTVFDENNTPGLPSSRIVHLFEDSRKNLWIGTETGGASVVREGRVQGLDIGRGSREGRLVASGEDGQGQVWLYTASGELCRYWENRVDVWTLGGSPLNTYRTLMFEEAGPLWVGTDWRMHAIDSAKVVESESLPIQQTVVVGKLDYLLASRGGGYWRLAGGRIQKWVGKEVTRDYGVYPWSNVAVSSACEDREGNLLVGTLGAGLFWFDEQGQVTRLSTDEGLAHNYVLSLGIDQEGSLWVGTDGGGLNRVRRQVFGVLEESQDLVAQTVALDDDGGVWIGYNGGGVDYWLGGEVKQYGAVAGVANLPIRSLWAGGSGRVWAGTWGGGLLRLEDGRFQRVPGSEFLNPVVLALREDRAGRLWVGTRGGLARRDEQGWRVFSTSDGLSASVVRALAEGEQGDMWVGTLGGGLNLIRDGRITVWRKEDGLPGEEITALHADADGVLWVGTSGQGLARFCEGRWTQYTTREGLVSNSVGYLSEDDEGYLWLGSNAGLMRIPKQALNDLAAGRTHAIACRTFGKADGLPTSECTPGAQVTTEPREGGRLWFPTIKGLAYVDPGKLQRNPHPPPVVIESVFIDGRSWATNRLSPDWTGGVVIAAGQERLEIHYTSLNLGAPELARFRYRMAGHESAWTAAGGDRVARYSKLPPGRYRFEVTASNEDGVWNEVGSALTILVEPPFWRTWWFLSGSVVLMLGVVVGGVHYLSTQRLQRQVERLRQQQALDNERARIARDLHDQLGASLTQISLLGELVEGDRNMPDEVESHARQITQTSRETTRTLDEIVWAVNPSNDTLEELITYFCKYAQEYLSVAGIRYRLDAPAVFPGTPLPPEVRHNVFLAAKEAVTNVVRHAEAGAVRIRLKLAPTAFVLEIEDDGRGLAGMDEKRARTRNGLSNMRRRMEEIGGRFMMTSGGERGTIVSLEAPLGGREPGEPG